MNSAIIVAAGQGARMGPGVDKLFLEVAGRPVVGHALQRFGEAAGIHEIIVVAREDQHDAFEELLRALRLNKPFRIVAGGKERQDSVWNGLEALSAQCEIVAIHDGARPCTPVGTIAATLEAARLHGAAVAAQRVTDTIKQSDDGLTIAQHLDRTRLWSVQTPQTFRVEVIRRALEAVRVAGRQVTDDTAACGLIGQPVELVDSALPNPKVTAPSDLPFIELLLRQGAGPGFAR